MHRFRGKTPFIMPCYIARYVPRTSHSSHVILDYSEVGKAGSKVGRERRLLLIHSMKMVRIRADCQNIGYCNCADGVHAALRPRTLNRWVWLLRYWYAHTIYYTIRRIQEPRKCVIPHRIGFLRLMPLCLRNQYRHHITSSSNLLLRSAQGTNPEAAVILASQARLLSVC